jgi:hypothetical protein
MSISNGKFGRVEFFHAQPLDDGPPGIVIKDWTKGETQLSANPSYPRSALSLHFARYAGRPPL